MYGPPAQVLSNRAPAHRFDLRYWDVTKKICDELSSESAENLILSGSNNKLRALVCLTPDSCVWFCNAGLRTKGMVLPFQVAR